MLVALGMVIFGCLGWRALDLMIADRAAERAMQERVASLKWTTKAALGAKPQASEPEPMPEDLVRRIQGWDDEFAKADEERAIRALYNEHRDWDKVRRFLPQYGLRAS